MSPEVRASLQSLVDDSFSWFVDIVAERRGLTRAEVLPLADGRIVTGNQGIADKLVDEVGGEAEAIAWLEANKSIKADLPVMGREADGVAVGTALCNAVLTSLVDGKATAGTVAAVTTLVSGLASGVRRARA